MKDYWHDACPKCGRRKYHRSKLCVKCRSEERPPRPSKHQKDTCECGRPKLVTSQKCRSCATGRDIELAMYRGRNKADLPSPAWDAVSRDWLVQFVGIFLSEGCVHTRLSPGGTLSLSLAIKLRDDDSGALYAIQAVLGGSVKHYGPKVSKPQATWTMTKKDDIRALLEAMQAAVVVPMRKATQFEIALQYLRWRDSVGFHHVDRAHIAEFHERLKAAKELARM